MIRIHDPLALIVVETVLIVVALVAAHRATSGRVWAWLWRSAIARPSHRRIAIGLFLIPVSPLLLAGKPTGPDPVTAVAARILLATLAMIVVTAFLVLRQHRLTREAQVRAYQKKIDALKGSAVAEAGAAVRTWILALNRCGVTAVDLNCCRMPGADLSRTRLYGAKLRGAELKGANLSEVGLTGADLRNARLAGTDLRQSFLYRADLRNADLSRADLTDADLRNADLRGARLDGCLLVNARLEEAKLAGASFCAARMKNTRVTVDQLLKTASLAQARLDPALHASLMAPRDPLTHLTRRLLSLDGTVPVTENATVLFSTP